MSAAIKKIQSDLVEEFEDCLDWKEKFSFICDLGKEELQGLEDRFKTEENRVQGCVSQVWILSELKDDKLYFKADSDSVFVKGLIAMVLRVYSGHPPQDILDSPPDFLKELGLSSHLTPSRANGLAAMIRRVMSIASRYRYEGKKKGEL